MKPKSFFSSFSGLFYHIFFSNLTRRIVVLNIFALAALVIGVLYINQSQTGLIAAKVDSLRAQGEIIAASIAASATFETDAITIDPDKFLELQTGESITIFENAYESMDFPIDPVKITPIIRRLISPTKTRAQIYDTDRELLVDSSAIYSRGQVFSQQLPPLKKTDEGLFKKVMNWVDENILFFRPLNIISEEKIRENAFEEVKNALNGNIATTEYRNLSGQIIVSVAIPIRRYRVIHGALLLSTREGEIEKIIAEERNAILRVFLVALIVTIILSLLLANTIAGPVKRLAFAAERVRKSIKAREEIPDFTDRKDEIGFLSGSLRDMTNSLYNRIEANETFAADVAHEIKNPLSSLRSAVEALPLTKKKEDSDRLMGIIQHDVQRLDRLISDISNASRLDAELMREDANEINVFDLVSTIASITNDNAKDGAVLVSYEMIGDAQPSDFTLTGHASRLSQVFDNIIQNARSFTQQNGMIHISMQRDNNQLIIYIDDDGPGFSIENTEKVFQRFYTDRPDGISFGENSGLGLAISRQIIEAHHGTIRAENRMEENKILGARFIIELPVGGGA